MNRLRIAVAAAVLASLASCGAPVVGTVVSKDYDDMDTYMTSQTDCTPINGKSVCTSHMVQRIDPEHYELKVRLDSDPDKTKTVSVDPGTYAKTTVGDHFEEGR